MPEYQGDRKKNQEAETIETRELVTPLPNTTANPFPIQSETTVNDQLIESEDFALAWLDDEQKFIVKPC